jgi:heat shock protein HtpX
MADPTGGQGPVLVYGRIARNRRKTVLLVACSILALAPFVFGTAYLVAGSIVWRVHSQTRQQYARVRADQAILRSMEDQTRTEWTQYMERRLEDNQALLAKAREADRQLLWGLMPVMACGMIAALGILFWGIASSPTSKLLVQVGAQPADDRDIEAKRLLENLAIGAGLPPPKLFVIESSAPNAFAAGMDPEHAVVAVTRGALNLFDKRELEGVLAHELSHIGNQDIRLNTFVASIALFLRIPYLMFRRELRTQSGFSRYQRARRRFTWQLVLSPFGLYILFVAPVLGALIRAAVSREREFLADADAALLTRYPEGLLHALAKIGGAGSAMPAANPAFSHFYFADPAALGGWFSGNLLATHPPLTERIQRLAQFQGITSAAGLEAAIKEGKKYTELHPAISYDVAVTPGSHDELAMLNQGNVMGRVYRLLSEESVKVYDTPSKNSPVIGYIKPGSLVVVFDDPGLMRQVNTADQTFGYIDRKIKLKPIDNMVPDEVYDPKLRAAAEAALARREEAAAAQARETPAPAGLTKTQIYVVVGFGGAVFAGMFALLLVLGK